MLTRPGVDRGWLMIERYRDREAFDRHLGLAHTRAFNAAARMLIEGAQSTVTDLAVAMSPDDRKDG